MRPRCPASTGPIRRLAAIFLLALGCEVAPPPEIEETPLPPVDSGLEEVDPGSLLPNHFYFTPRAPLPGAILSDLPPGLVTPEGKLREELERVREEIEADLEGSETSPPPAHPLLLALLGDRSALDRLTSRLLERETPSPGALAIARLIELHRSTSDDRILERLQQLRRTDPAPEARAAYRDLLTYLYDLTGERELLARLEALPGRENDAPREDLSSEERLAGLLRTERSVLDGEATRSLDGLAGELIDDRELAPERRIALARYALRLWRATPGDGLALLSYRPSRVSALVGEDAGVLLLASVSPVPDRPGHHRIDLEPRIPVHCPLLLLAPPDSGGIRVSLNRRPSRTSEPGRYLAIWRRWRSGDRLEVELLPPGDASR